MIIQEKIVMNYIDKLWNKTSLKNSYIFTVNCISIHHKGTINPHGSIMINSKDEMINILRNNNMMDKLSEKISIKIEIRKEIVLELIKEASKEEKNNIYQNINTFVGSQYYGESDFNICIDLMTSLRSDGFEKEAHDLFYHMPKKIAKLSSWKEDIYQANLQSIQSFFKDDADKYILMFLSKRAEQINNSQKLQVVNRDFLLKTYSGNKEIMLQYQDMFPELKKYLESNDNDDFFVKEIENNINILIDLEKIKSIVAIKKWTNKDYVRTLSILLSTIKRKDKNINKITTKKLKIDKNKDYLNITINVKDLSLFSEEQCKVRITKFMKMIKEHLIEEEKMTEIFVDKCYSALMLEEQLSTNSNDKIRVKTKL